MGIFKIQCSRCGGVFNWWSGCIYQVCSACLKPIELEVRTQMAKKHATEKKKERQLRDKPKSI